MCLAGHGDDDYVHASPEWIQLKQETKKPKSGDSNV